MMARSSALDVLIVTQLPLNSCGRVTSWMKTSEMVKTTSPMIDPFGRHITYLRVSVTDRCDFRCVYCMTENMTFLPKKDLLTLEEIDRLASA
jgi:GTP 3',8-cyclase